MDASTLRAMLRARASMLTEVRRFFALRDVTEVHTPVLASGTITDPDIAAIAVPGHGFLQTSPEYFLKRLLAAGMSDCYQLGPVFRADERGRLHDREFTLLEWYRLGYDHHQLMAEVAELVDAVMGPAPVRHTRYATLVDDVAAPREVLDLAFAQACEALSGRVFVTDYPADQAALARLVEPESRWASRFELVIDGVEIANGYWELLDPQEHRRRFEDDRKARVQRGLPEVAVDEAFLAALEQGLPACAGVALGIDRLFMLAQGKSSLDAVLPFR